MDKQIGESSESTSRSCLVNSSVEEVSLSLENLSLTDGSAGSSGSNNTQPLSPLVHNHRPASQEPGFYSDQEQETCFKNSRQIPMPLYSDNVWAGQGNSRQGFMPAHGQESLSNTLGIQFVEYAWTEHGSKELQTKLNQWNPELTQSMFQIVMACSGNGSPFIFHLMINGNGKHVFTKLASSCNYQQLELITAALTMNRNTILYLSLHMHGCDCIKYLIKLLKKSPLISSIITSLSLGFWKLMIDRDYGVKVISQCLDQLDSRQNQLLYEAGIVRGLDLAIHQQGCISLNNVFIDKITGPHRHVFLAMISDNAIFLSYDPYGNFVVQKVIGLQYPIFTRKICILLIGHYATLSVLKGGSHVVEKCLKSRDFRFAVEEFVGLGIKELLQIARDQYGNYVIQAALVSSKQAKNPLHLRLMTRLNENAVDLQSKYGKKVLETMGKLSDKSSVI